ncbi:MAG: acetyl-CoA carboxylase biotin carboxyl carrier protein, partial [Chitinophagia bacterium]|nr:acetyl-CoA carboxylase biotin carboxyl carrier protein [Chitinophagia bacterium]
DLIRTVIQTNISELNIEDRDFKISIKQGSGASAPVATVISTPVAQAVVAVEAPVAAPEKVEVAPPAAPKAPQAMPDNLITVKSPMIGTFYRSPSPDKPPFASVGDKVSKGQALCIIEAMKLFNEIECEYNGTVVKVLVDDNSPVEYDQPLFLLQP